MKVYLAGPYQWKDKITVYAKELWAQGIEVTSTWLDEPHAPNTQLGELADEQHNFYAMRDLEDIDRADAFVLFTVPPPTVIPRAGRHVEFGYALKGGKVLIIVGEEKENIFHYLRMAQMTQEKTWEDAKQVLIGMKYLEEHTWMGNRGR